MKRNVPWKPPPWFVTFQARLRFIRQAQQVVEGPVTVVKPSRKYRGGFAVSFAVMPHGVPSRTVHVEFNPGNPEIPRVFTDGPKESPHRYADGSLCMWYPRDPIDLQWARRDGAAALIGCIALHLIREQWWRETGEWPGPGVPHPVQQTRPQRIAA